LAADAGVSDDNFALVGVTRHPHNNDHVAVRYVQRWLPNGGKIDFDLVEAEIARLCNAFHVVLITYDPYQLHQMMTGLTNSGLVYCSEFGQQKDRLEADRGLRDLIMQKRIAHDGNPELRAHIDNADAKIDATTRKIRMVKGRGKIDGAVALSMAVHKCLALNL
jgi:phage terminase large subunit-like protein